MCCYSYIGYSALVSNCVEVLYKDGVYIERSQVEVDGCGSVYLKRPGVSEPIQRESERS